ncbi:cytochrome-c oxidase, cbb3-type subunit III [Steroidobacter agaridevorans]|uniref:cytochrome-c oxidase, cbb3-type subunit III n=1 Tax=Steroidobacter agaridevorans TaxID=2695856 RepID=UPI001329DAEA|nr:cytochrome-c oxidase, cbb3-type subunit III [Steroidobacter agaridevorans]GFE91663.1 Cbb3-type cytochrome c oxidase subunit [Steroidobacter agaridevorans]
MIRQPASVFIIVFTAINIVACLWLMWWTARTRVPVADTSDQKSAEGSGATGHVWDGDLEELNNPLPRWWLGLFIVTILFGAAYLTFYPGMGNFAGTSKWSSVGQYEEQVARQRANFEERLASLQDRSLTELANNGNAMATAKNLYSANCAGCHGSDARGAKGFPNLTDQDWLWGGDEQRLLESIAQGRHGMMPALGGALGEQGVNEVASYVVSLSGGKAPADWVAAGQQRFATLCVGCHGVDAKGNAMLGAPNLTDNIWLHGGDFDTVRATITNGRDNQMPAHRDLLGDTKVKLLAAYVLSLNEAQMHAAN